MRKLFHQRGIARFQKYILAILEPNCKYWHIRETFDDPDVNDGCAPQQGEFDTLIPDSSDPLNFAFSSDP